MAGSLHGSPSGGFHGRRCRRFRGRQAVEWHPRVRPRNLYRLRPDNAESSSRAPSIARKDQQPALRCLSSADADGTFSNYVQRYGLSRTTVAKWRARATTDDAPMGPSSPHSTVMTQAEEAMVSEFRRRTLLPLDDVLGGSSQGSGGGAAGKLLEVACGTAFPS